LVDGLCGKLCLLVLGSNLGIDASGCWVHVVEGVACHCPLCDGLVHWHCNEGDGQLNFWLVCGGSVGANDGCPEELNWEGAHLLGGWRCSAVHCFYGLDDCG